MIKILFQGDSITDAGRDRQNPRHLGGDASYPLYAAEHVRRLFPDVEFDFFNLGIGGDELWQLEARWQRDCIDYSPDIVSVLIGINDTWHRVNQKREFVPDDEWGDMYARMLSEVKEKTGAKIIIIEEFLLYVPDKEAAFRPDVNNKIGVTRAIARRFADAYVPADGIFAAASVKAPPTHWAADGVHPTPDGARLLGAAWAETAAPIIRELIEKKSK
ncbi:MAG TPA: GDSL-type esterase/lipase family protein [Bacillota bacterium]|nr:GDSL family lipase [Clostridiales bacterium]HPU18108.1 GDSL-type esterase/lipase family protein [Bacillota bacterium]